MDNYWERKERGSGNYGSRGVWGNRSSSNRRAPLAGQRRDSVPSWEKKFCESICLIPWHKLLEAKKFMHLYDNVIRWNDTAAEEAFKNAKSRYWAEMNGLPCNVKLPDPDTYIDKVDWNSNVDPELLLDLERGLEMDSKVGGSEVDFVTHGKPFMLDNEPVFCDQGWGNLDEVAVPVLPPRGSADSQGWMNWNETDQCGGWNNWDDEVNNNYGSKCDLEGSGWVDDSYGNSNMANGTSDPWQGSGTQRHLNECAGNNYGGGWGQERVNRSSSWDHGHYSPGKDVAFVNSTGRNQAPPNNHWRSKEGDGYGLNRGFKNNRGRRRQERPRWQDRNPSRW
ncbi:hypothetical protein V2J09_023957 [Rumex salicifolius]